MKIEVLGTGCHKCNTLEARTRAVVESLGLACDIVHVKEIAKFASYGVMMTPALVVDGEVVATGNVPSEAELTTILTTAASKG